MRIETTAIADVLLLWPERHGDGRGFLAETWSRRRMAACGLDIDFRQENEAFTHKAGTVRGLHFQAPPRAQDKLVRVVSGRIWDVAVDLRRASPTYGRWVGAELSAGDGGQMLIPRGFAHGYCTLEDHCRVVYLLSDDYDPACEGAVAWDDPDIGVDWPVQAPLLSDKDRRAGRLAELRSPF